MKLFLTNSTTQTIVFHYRDPLTKLLHNVEIGRGGQQSIGSKKWTRNHIDDVIKQAERSFGAHDAAEVHGKIKKFSGLSYRVDGVIEVDEILAGHEQVRKMQNDRSVEQAVNSALATDRAANPERGHRRTKQTVIEVEQIVPPGQRPKGDETKFSLVVDAENGGDRLVKESVAA